MFAATKTMMTAAKTVPAPVFDALGVSPPATFVINTTWNHTPVAAGVYVIVDVSCTNGNLNVGTMTYDGRAMTQIGAAQKSSNTYGDSISFFRFGIYDTTTTTKVIALNTGGGYICAQSISYTGVVSVGRSQPINGNGTSLSHSVINETGGLIVQAFGAQETADFTASGGGTNRYRVYNGGNAGYSLREANVSTTFTATTSGGTDWVGLATVLNGTPGPFVVGWGTGSNAATFPTHQVGDLLLVAAMERANGLPTAPAGSGTTPTWNVINSAGANSMAMTTAGYVAVATNHTTGSWSNTSSMLALVVRGALGVLPIGGHAMSGSASEVGSTAPAITLLNTAGSLLLDVHSGSSTATSWSAAPSGYVRHATTTDLVFNQKADPTTDGSVVQGSTAAAAASMASSFEILPAAYVSAPFTPTSIENTSIPLGTDIPRGLTGGIYLTLGGRGGGGGQGRIGATSSARSGGAGGGAGGWIPRTFIPVAALGWTHQLTYATTGGLGAVDASGTTAANGAAGTTGGASSFVSGLINWVANGGVGGNGGSTGAVVNGGAGGTVTGATTGVTGGAGASTSSTSPYNGSTAATNTNGATGGGAGGGIATTNTSRGTGGAGGTNSSGTGGAGGLNNGTSGGTAAGQPGAAAVAGQPGRGGGGAGSTSTSSTGGESGGAGTGYGAGGGGGSGRLTTNVATKNSGADGGPAYSKIEYTNTLPPVAYDTVGAGGGTLGSFSYTITAAIGADVFAVVVYERSGVSVTSVTANGAAMTPLASVDSNNVSANGGMTVYRAAGAGNGSAITINVTISGSAWCVGDAMSVNYVTTVGTPTTTFGSGTALSQAVTVPAGGLVLQYFCETFNNAGVGTPSGFTGCTNRSVRSSNGTAATALSTTTTTGTVAATNSSTTPWAGISIPIS